jgi:hypothetical protein
MINDDFRSLPWILSSGATVETFLIIGRSVRSGVFLFRPAISGIELKGMFKGREYKNREQMKSRSVKCTTKFPATLIDRADYFFQPTKTLFVARTYDLLENLREVLEQFHRFAAQHGVFLSRHHLASGLIPESKTQATTQR